VVSMLSVLLRAQRSVHLSPAAMLASLDQRLSESLQPGVFVTMCYAVLEPTTGRLTFASAGHNPLLVWRCDARKVEVRASKGIPLGAIRGGAIRATLRDETVQLRPGDVCLQFTDGYTEAFQPGSGEQFGVERLQQVFEQHAQHGGEAVRRALGDAIRAWSGDGVPADDETMLVVTCEGGLDSPEAGDAAETRDEAEVRAAVEQLGRARQLGHGLELTARLDQLASIGPWARGLVELAALPAERLEVIVTALYEACANIVEHGCNEDGRPGIQVWWLPASAAGGASLDSPGRFVIRDGGRPFRPFDRVPTDFNDPAVRTRGRGLGLEIMHRAMEVTYHPATPQGNITVLSIGPVVRNTLEEEIRA
jgi:anti-sigma regulatory factor (Ser/Thr protein kinase)